MPGLPTRDLGWFENRDPIVAIPMMSALRLIETWWSAAGDHNDSAFADIAIERR